ncbi:hypothetical protein [Microbacterium radiodurans]|uniref:hypothetical protein n=1 Tax=Microbacterium radiodurans TaxID=661398 RepID=UPI00168BDE06|nr:hypothetical protein [Microbacterium radiodurans]
MKKRFELVAGIGSRNRLIHGVIAAVAAIAIVNDAGRGAMAIAGRTLFVGEGTRGGLPLTWLPMIDAAQLASGATGDLRDADVWLRIGAGSPLIIEAATAAIAAVLLLRILRSVARATPFSSTVVAGLRRLAIVLLSGGIAAGVLSTVASIYLIINAGPVSGSDRLAFLGANYSDLTIGLPQWPIPLIIGGLIAVALLAAFRSGAQLMDDVDGVI